MDPSYDQVGAVPYRRRDGTVEILLITTRSTGRWICPKGNIEADLGPQDSAKLEAYEEGGVSGQLVAPVLGVYQHGSPPTTAICMWLLEVDTVHDAWPEDDERSRQWLPLPAARATAQEPGLCDLLETARERLA